MKTYQNERYANKLAKEYRSGKRILMQAGRLNRLKSDREEIDEQYLDAAVLELRLNTGNLNIPERVVG